MGEFWRPEDSEERRKQLADREADKQKHLAMTELEAMEAGKPVWYQRMRYLREDELAKRVERLRFEQALGTPVKATGRRGGF